MSDRMASRWGTFPVQTSNTPQHFRPTERPLPFRTAVGRADSRLSMVVAASPPFTRRRLRDDRSTSGCTDGPELASPLCPVPQPNRVGPACSLTSSAPCSCRPAAGVCAWPRCDLAAPHQTEGGFYDPDTDYGACRVPIRASSARLPRPACPSAIHRSTARSSRERSRSAGVRAVGLDWSGSKQAGKKIWQAHLAADATSRILLSRLDRPFFLNPDGRW